MENHGGVFFMPKIWGKMAQMGAKVGYAKCNTNGRSTVFGGESPKMGKFTEKKFLQFMGG